MIPSMLSGPPASPTDDPSADAHADVAEGFGGRSEVVKTALECVFIGIAVFSLVLCLLLRLICVRRAGRHPFRDFLKPLPDTVRSVENDTAATFRAGRPYSVSAQPRSPGRAHTRPQRSSRQRAPDERWLPAYDDKDTPPRYQDIVVADASPPQTPTDHSSTTSLVLAVSPTTPTSLVSPLPSPPQTSPTAHPGSLSPMPVASSLIPLPHPTCPEPDTRGS